MGPLNVRTLKVASELRRGSMAKDVKRLILICEECAEKRMVLCGALSVWHLGRTTFFACECGRRLALADRLESRKLAEADTASNATLPTQALYN